MAKITKCTELRAFHVDLAICLGIAGRLKVGALLM